VTIKQTLAAIDAKLADIAAYRADFDDDPALEGAAIDFLSALQSAWEHATGNDTIPDHVLRGVGIRIRNGRIVGGDS
jgi:hypothetical protein